MLQNMFLEHKISRIWWELLTIWWPAPYCVVMVDTMQRAREPSWNMLLAWRRKFGEMTSPWYCHKNVVDTPAVRQYASGIESSENSNAGKYFRYHIPDDNLWDSTCSWYLNIEMSVYSICSLTIWQLTYWFCPKVQLKRHANESNWKGLFIIA